MNCRKCNYPLWNLPDRRCPECGQEFVPSDFDFVARSVRFLCPHCQQQYFGTDDRGHLVPRSFNCVKCQQFIDIDEMILVPAENTSERDTQKDVNPWTDSFAGGPIKRWWITLGRSFVNPTRLIKSTPPESTSRRALGFALTNVMLPWLLSIGVVMVFAALPMAGGRGGGAGAFGFLLVMLALWILGPLIFLLLWAGISHFILAITGPSESFRRTAHSLWYSSGPYVMCAVPCLGAYLAPVAIIWWGVCATLMMTRAHNAGGFRSTIAIFTPVVILLGGIAALIAWFFWWASTMAISAAALAASTYTIQNQRATSVVSALNTYGNTNSGYPKHAIELLSSGSVGIGELSFSTDPLAADNIPIAGTTLGKFEMAKPDGKDQIAANAVAGLPPSVIAHRLGDYVFTYHGITPSTADAGLWLFVAEIPSPPSPSPPAPVNVAPTPGQNGIQPAVPQLNPPPPSGSPPMARSGVVVTPGTNMPSFIVGLANGRTQTIPKVIMPQMLLQQNQLRATFSLPPLPDPTTVTISAPAMGPK